MSEFPVDERHARGLLIGVVRRSAKGLIPAAVLAMVLGASWFASPVRLPAINLTAACSYVAGAAPTVTSVVPNSGTAAGGTSVTINGCNFTGVTAVRFGTTAATSFVFVSDSQITAVSPVHAAGTVDVTVTTPVSPSAVVVADQFTFTLMTWYFDWYDFASPGVNADTIHITNPGSVTATGTISMPGAASISFSVTAGQNAYFTFPYGTIGGPVTISSNQTILSTLRAWYYQSFNEIWARPGSAAATVVYFPWYDLASAGTRADTIHITNVSGSSATGTIALPGATTLNFTVANGTDAYFSFPYGTIGGPVKVTSNQPVLASLRAWYYQSFNEIPAG